MKGLKIHVTFSRLFVCLFAFWKNNLLTLNRLIKTWLKFALEIYTNLFVSCKKFSKTWTYVSSRFKSSRPKVFCKIGFLKNFARFTGKHLCHSLFFNKVARRQSLFNLLKKRLGRRCFPVNFAKFLRKPSLQYTSGRLFLDSVMSMFFLECTKL